MIIVFQGLDDAPHEVDTESQIDFVLDRDEGADPVCTINGVPVAEDQYESVMAQLRAFLE